MKSPFPGMDPYLERHWRGVHTSLIAAAGAQLNTILPSDLVARIEERVYVDNSDESSRPVFPDVHVVESAVAAGFGRIALRSPAVTAPVLLLASEQPAFDRYLEIRTLEGGQLITAIEFLSPTNKTAGPGRDSFLQKRKEFSSAGVHVVEIDLVRAGQRSEIARPFVVPARHDSTYRVSVHRAQRKHAALELYPIDLKSRLPVISVPLRAADADATLDIQHLMDHVYESGRFATSDYSRKLEPPFSDDEEEWVAEQIRVWKKAME